MQIIDNHYLNPIVSGKIIFAFGNTPVSEINISNLQPEAVTITTILNQFQFVPSPYLSSIIR